MKACVMLEITKVSLSSEGQFNQTKTARAVSRAILKPAYWFGISNSHL